LAPAKAIGIMGQADAVDLFNVSWFGDLQILTKSNELTANGKKSGCFPDDFFMRIKD